MDLHPQCMPLLLFLWASCDVQDLADPQHPLSLLIPPMHDQHLLPPLSEFGEVILLTDISLAPLSIQTYLMFHHLNSLKTSSMLFFLTVYHKHFSPILSCSLVLSPQTSNYTLVPALISPNWGFFPSF